MKIRYRGTSRETGETVTGWYWENQGVGYIVTDDESIQPPVRRTHSVDPEKVEVVMPWIQVEERLPEVKKECETYLCTIDGEEYGEEDPIVVMLAFEDGIWDEDGVIAWMPLPDPYCP